MTSVLQSQGRFWPANQVSTKFRVLKKRKRSKKYSQTRCAKSRHARTSRRHCGYALARIAPKPLVLKRFVNLDLFNSTAIDRESKTLEKPCRESLEKQVGPDLTKNALFEKKKSEHVSEVTFAKCRPSQSPKFRTVKQVVSETAGRQLTLPGPLMFWHFESEVLDSLFFCFYADPKVDKIKVRFWTMMTFFGDPNLVQNLTFTLVQNLTLKNGHQTCRFQISLKPG